MKPLNLSKAKPVKAAAAKPKVQKAEKSQGKKEDEFTFDYLMTVINSRMGQNQEPLTDITNIEQPRTQCPDENDEMRISYEVKSQADEIVSKEEDLVRRARELEEEMKAIKRAKIEVVVKQFEQ